MFCVTSLCLLKFSRFQLVGKSVSNHLSLINLYWVYVLHIISYLKKRWEVDKWIPIWSSHRRNEKWKRDRLKKISLEARIMQPFVSSQSHRDFLVDVTQCEVSSRIKADTALHWPTFWDLHVRHAWETRLSTELLDFESIALSCMSPCTSLTSTKSTS